MNLRSFCERWITAWDLWLAKHWKPLPYRRPRFLSQVLETYVKRKSHLLTKCISWKWRLACYINKFWSTVNKYNKYGCFFLMENLLKKNSCYYCYFSFFLSTTFSHFSRIPKNNANKVTDDEGVQGKAFNFAWEKMKLRGLSESETSHPCWNAFRKAVTHSGFTILLMKLTIVCNWDVSNFNLLDFNLEFSSSQVKTAPQIWDKTGFWEICTNKLNLSLTENQVFKMSQKLYQNNRCGWLQLLMKLKTDNKFLLYV